MTKAEQIENAIYSEIENEEQVLRVQLEALAITTASATLQRIRALQDLLQSVENVSEYAGYFSGFATVENACDVCGKRNRLQGCALCATCYEASGK